MDKRKILVLSVLAVFVVGMSLASVGAVDAKTITVKPKLDKYAVKKSGKYTVQAAKTKDSKKQTIVILVDKNGKRLKGNQFKTKLFFKYKGKSQSTKWLKGSKKVPGQAYTADKKIKLNKVKVKV